MSAWLASWQGAAVLAALFIGAHYLTLRAATGKIADAIGALCLEGAAALGIALLLVFKVFPASPITLRGVLWSVVSGLCITGATTLLFTALRRGGPVSATGTIVLGGGVTLAALLAPLVYGEAMTLRRGIGVALGVAAMIVLAKS
jgi:uncharacterized membrane protein